MRRDVPFRLLVKITLFIKICLLPYYFNRFSSLFFLPSFSSLLFSSFPLFSLLSSTFLLLIFRSLLDSSLLSSPLLFSPLPFFSLLYSLQLSLSLLFSSPLFVSMNFQILDLLLHNFNTVTENSPCYLQNTYCFVLYCSGQHIILKDTQSLALLSLFSSLLLFFISSSIALLHLLFSHCITFLSLLL